MILDRLAREVEALLFASDAPLSARQLGELTGSGEESLVQAVERIDAAFREQGHAFHVVEVAGGYRIATDPEYGPVVSQLFEGQKPGRLTRAALETLAVIAYSQPCSRAAIEAIRGVNCDSALRTLIERDMVKISGRMESPGRPLLYATTTSFLEYFGLADLDHLPRMEEISGLLGMTSSELEERDLFRTDDHGE